MNGNFDRKIDYVVYESVLARVDRLNKRLLILCIIMLLALIGTNAGWIIYESSYVDSITVSQDVDTEQSPAYVNATGEVTIYGEGSSDD
jgi:hypothetical protein